MTIPSQKKQGIADLETGFRFNLVIFHPRYHI